jgi:3',5'-cyclic AMP phosphodiesterase CpdA
MVDDPNSEDQYRDFMDITGRLDPDVPVRWVPGNHDVAADTVVPTSESIAAYRAAFGPDYYGFDCGPLRFLAMNTVVIDHPELVPDEWEAQFAFLRGEMEAAASAQRTVVLVGHHPLFKRRADEEDDYWNLPRERRRPLLDLVHRHRVPLALAGHWHRNSLARDGDFEMVTTGPVGYPLGADPSGFRVLEMEEGKVHHRYRALDS